MATKTGARKRSTKPRSHPAPALERIRIALANVRFTTCCERTHASITSRLAKGTPASALIHALTHPDHARPCPYCANPHRLTPDVIAQTVA